MREIVGARPPGPPAPSPTHSPPWYATCLNITTDILMSRTYFWSSDNSLFFCHNCYLHIIYNPPKKNNFIPLQTKYAYAGILLSVCCYVFRHNYMCMSWLELNTPFETCSSLNNLHTKPWKTRQFSILNHYKIWMKRILTRWLKS